MNEKYNRCNFCKHFQDNCNEGGVCKKYSKEVSRTDACENYEYRLLTEMCDNGVYLLRDTIIKDAIKDMKNALKRRKKVLEKLVAKETIGLRFELSKLDDEIRSYERFFKSEYFKILCSIDGEKVITHIYETAFDPPKQRKRIDRRKYIEFNGERMSLKDWSKKLNISCGTLYWRLTNGWSVEQTFTEGVGANE